MIPKRECYDIHKSQNRTYEKYVHDGNVCIATSDVLKPLETVICFRICCYFKLILISSQDLSGSPLYCNLEHKLLSDKVQEFPIFRGLLTWSTKINQYPHLFTNIAQYIDWIEDTINQNIYQNVRISLLINEIALNGERGNL